MTVLEVSPGGGWYTEVLAPLLKDHGQLVAGHGAPMAVLMVVAHSVVTYRSWAGS